MLTIISIASIFLTIAILQIKQNYDKIAKKMEEIWKKDKNI